jgi:hypothetical protein
MMFSQFRELECVLLDVGGVLRLSSQAMARAFVFAFEENRKEMQLVDLPFPEL